TLEPGTSLDPLRGVSVPRPEVGEKEKSIMLRKTILMALAFALSSSAAFAADVPERKSLQVINDITKQVRQYTRYTIFDDVSVRLADNGVAVLTGKVTMPFKKDDIGRLVGRVQGVSTVQNEI